jgi:oxygen-independent coproporphyrinogen III oxidase
LNHDTALPVIRQRQIQSAAAILAGIDPRQEPARSLYIHVPFCFHKCHYCDFYSIVDTRDRQEAFTSRLRRELAALAPWTGGQPLRTVFVGGGTPTLLRVGLWEQLLSTLRECFDLTGGGEGEPEFTVECNPETATPDLMACLRAGGVNRVSIGAQSFNPAHLKTLERWHDPENVAKAVEMARSAGIARHSLDLIFAIPGQTLGEWQADLERALALGTAHLSCYSLTYEPNTAMTVRLARGEFEPAAEDLEADMFELTLSFLRSAGLERYEVSNFARPGDEARHNLAYWRHESWLAAGPSASAHIGGHRWKNAPRLDDYLSTDEGGFAPITGLEPPDPRRAAREKIMTGLRIAEGLPAAAVLPLADQDRLGKRLQNWRDAGHLIESGGFWRLTDSGFLIADSIAADLMGAIR